MRVRVRVRVGVGVRFRGRGRGGEAYLVHANDNFGGYGALQLGLVRLLLRDLVRVRGRG